MVSHNNKSVRLLPAPDESEDVAGVDSLQVVVSLHLQQQVPVLELATQPVKGGNLLSTL